MKKLILFILLLFVLTAYGQQFDVPQEVRIAFSKRFPEAKDISWIKKSENFEAEFFYKDDLKAALYDANGVWLQTSTAVSEEEIPEKALNEINKEYEDGFINDAAVVTDNNNNTYYNVSVYTDQAAYYLKINDKGDILETMEEINAADDYDLDIDESEFDYNEE